MPDPDPYCPELLPKPAELPEPGLLPPGSRLPHPRYTTFTGRTDELHFLAAALLYSDVNRPVVITQPESLAGLGGIGKTQLAIEFCYRYGRFFQGVHWLQAEMDVNFQISLCGKAMGLSPWPDSLPEQVALTLQAWQRQPHRLIVLDDLANPNLLAELPIEMKGARLLITSTQPSGYSTLDVHSRQLELLPRADSLALLCKLAPQLVNTPEDELNRLAQRLGDCPLALYLAGMYLNIYSSSAPANYMRKLNQLYDLIDQAFLTDWQQNYPTDYAQFMGEAFLVSWGQIEAWIEDEWFYFLFELAGYIIPNTPIPLAVFRKVIEFSGGEINDSLLNEFMALLQMLGLFLFYEDNVLIHPLVAEYARRQDRVARWKTLRTLDNILVEINYDAEPLEQLCSLLCLHPYFPMYVAAESAKLAEAEELWDVYVSIVTTIAGNPTARAAFVRALAIDEAVYGCEHLNVGWDLNTLGLVLIAEKDYPAAYTHFMRALAVWEKNLGPTHRFIVFILNSLIEALCAMEEYTAARAACERALAIDETLYSPNHPTLSRDLNHLGGILFKLGDYSAARAILERALTIDEAIPGSNRRDVARDADKLYQVLRAVRDYPAASAVYERALEIMLTKPGADTWEAAGEYKQLGDSLKAQGDLRAASAAYKYALAIWDKQPQRDRKQLADGYRNLGEILFALDNHPAACTAYERALLIDESIYGSDLHKSENILQRYPDGGIIYITHYSSQVARDVTNLGSALYADGDYTAACAAYERAIKINESLYGANDPILAGALYRLGNARKALGEYPEARIALERALEIQLQEPKPNYQNIALAANGLGEVLRTLENYTAARVAFERALANLKQVDEPDQLHVAYITNNLGLTLKQLGDFPGARTAFERALEIWEKQCGPNHPDVACALLNLGNVLEAQGDFSAARVVLERSLAIGEAVYDPNHPNLAKTLRALGVVLYDEKDYPSARAVIERALRIHELIVGAKEIWIASDFDGLGVVLSAQGEYSAAHAAFERALAIYEAIYGSNHPEVARTLNNIGEVLFIQGDYRAARAAFERSLPIFVASLGTDHPNTKIVRHSLDVLNNPFKSIITRFFKYNLIRILRIAHHKNV